MKQISDKKTLYHQDIKRRTANIFIIAGLIILICLGAFAIWAMTTWDEVNIQEIIFHMGAPLQGTGQGMIWTAIITIVFPTIILSGIIVLLYWGLRDKKKRKIITTTLYSVAGFGFITLLMCGWNWLGMTEFLTLYFDESTFINDHYVNPEKVELSFPQDRNPQDQNRNLIYIFLESMETTWSDTNHGGAWDVDLIPELTNLALENDCFSKPGVLNGSNIIANTGWTAAALFSQTCGLPLAIPIMQNDMDKEDKFFPTIPALGNVLQEHGYTNTFMIGSDARFGGRDMYFESHGDYAIKDYEYFRADPKYFESEGLPEDYYVFWGFEDKHLFNFAKRDLITKAKEAQNGTPFNMTLLTVDTHFEDGYLCDECPDTHKSQYENVYSCASKRINDFINWYFSGEDIPLDVANNTTIILAGDHLTMDADFTRVVENETTRKAYVCYINSAAKQKPLQEGLSQQREFCSFDAFPTTLAALGVEIEGDRLGLGTNLYSGKSTYIEEMGVETFSNEMIKKSQFMSDAFHGKELI